MYELKIRRIQSINGVTLLVFSEVKSIDIKFFYCHSTFTDNGKSSPQSWSTTAGTI